MASNGQRKNTDLLLATAPDCDRVGLAVKDENGEYVLLSGNEVGLLLLVYICSQRAKHGKIPENSVMVKTIVTMDLGERIAEYFGVNTINVLTGFNSYVRRLDFLKNREKKISIPLALKKAIAIYQAAR